MDSLPSRGYEAATRQAEGDRKGRTRPANLREQIAPIVCQAYDDAREESGFWPTVTTDSATARTKKYSQGGTPLALAVQFFPTATAADPFSGNLKSSQQKPGSMHSVNLSDAVRMFATPQSRDFRSGQASRWQDERRSRNLNDQLATPESGLLNPDWVEWLVGLPTGWTDIDRDVPVPKPDSGWWPAEPEGVPRVAAAKNRVDRLKGLGNMAMPAQFYPFFAAIAEVERSERDE